MTRRASPSRPYRCIPIIVDYDRQNRRQMATHEHNRRSKAGHAGHRSTPRFEARLSSEEMPGTTSLFSDNVSRWLLGLGDHLKRSRRGSASGEGVGHHGDKPGGPRRGREGEHGKTARIVNPVAEKTKKALAIRDALNSSTNDRRRNTGLLSVMYRPRRNSSDVQATVGT